MKTKLMLLSLALASCAVTASAQSTREKFSSNGGDNIFVSATGGVSTIYAGENEGGFGKVAPHVTVSLGKWFNPVIGLRLQAGAWKSNYDTNYANGTYTANGLNENAQQFDKTTGVVRFDALYNLSNAIAGYNPNRVFTLSAFAGPGLSIAKTAIGQIDFNTANNTYQRVTVGKEKTRAHINGSVGLLGKFNVTRSLDIDLEARAEVADSYLSYKSTASSVGALYFGAGLTYTFGGKNFVPVNQKVDNSALNDEINRLRNDLAKAQADLNDCRNALANVKPEVREVEKIVESAAPRAIFFQLGSARLDDYGKVNIQLAAKAMKDNTNIKYRVIGYADKATGSAAGNKRLTDKRAQVVYDALIAQGVSESQIEMVSEGGTDNMFGANKLNRVVLIEK